MASGTLPVDRSDGRSGACPVHNAQATAPTEYRSVHGPSSHMAPRTCSGAAYPGDPPSSTSSRSVRARPKSDSTHRSPSRRMFPGFTSRCRTPREWAWARARRTWVSTSSTSTFEASARLCSARSSAIHGTETPSTSTSPVSRIRTMLGWCSAAATRTSVRTAFANRGTWAARTDNSFTATSGFPSTDQTSAIPPAPRSWSSRNGPAWKPAKFTSADPLVWVVHYRSGVRILA